MPLYAFDGASAFNLAAAKAAGGILCTTYIRGTPGGMAHATAARVAAIRALGMGAHPNWEATADFFGTCTIAEAKWAGQDALAACQALGYPADGSIRCSFSFDFQVPTSRFPEMGQKVNAITAGLAGHYGTMIYGQQSLIDWLVAHGFVTGPNWLMMSTFNQPYNPISPNVCIVQGHDINGNWINSHVPGTDVNTVTQPNLVGAWWPPNSPYSGADMTITDADATVLWSHTIDHNVGTAAQALRDASQSASAAHDIATAALSAVAVLRTDMTTKLAALTQVVGEPTHPTTNSLRNAVMGAVAGIPTNLELAAALELALSGVGIALTDEQVQQVAETLAAAIPTSTPYTLSGTLTPTEPPTPTT